MSRSDSTDSASRGEMFGEFGLVLALLAWANGSSEGLPTRNCLRRFRPRAENFRPHAFFSLACGDDSCILHLRTRFTAARERGSFRRTRVRIEFDICSRAVPFPRHPDHQKESCKT